MVEKAREYGDRRVPDYWTIDWDRLDPHIIVRGWDKSLNQYVEQTYLPGDVVVSARLPGLNLVVTDILAGEP